MKSSTIKADTLLLITAFIWGLAFVAQRVGMQYVEPFTFNAIRFALGAMFLIPLYYLKIGGRKLKNTFFLFDKNLLIGAAIAGVILFFGASFQQMGIVYTSAGKAGFITGLYVVFVPIIGIFYKHKITLTTLIGTILAAIGLYFLSVTGQFTIVFGDMLVLISAIFFALHVIVIDKYSKKCNVLKFAFIQYLTCSVLSCATALMRENINWNDIFQAKYAIFYAGVFSIGIAYTFQFVGQKEAQPSHAAIILSLEAVFAAICGWIILHEFLSIREIIGCLLMMTGMLSSQFSLFVNSRKIDSS